LFLSGPERAFRREETIRYHTLSPMPPIEPSILPLLPVPLPLMGEHPCQYLPGRVARERAFRAGRVPPADYQQLMDRGMRRTGDYFYVPDCAACRACVPIRIPVDGFMPSKSQRRVRRRNNDITLAVGPLECSPESFALYQRYLAEQHPDSASTISYDSFREWLYVSAVDTLELRYLLGDQTVAISIVDVCPDTLSSVCHFFDPTHASRSLGVYSVLAEIDVAHRLGLRWYSLGYWIAGAPTMAYKANYHPHELLVDGRWVAASP
jgi:arginine-tRNA-protein transferase